MFTAIVVHQACTKDKCESQGYDDKPLIGQSGTPRFNLNFSNEHSVDLDLYVQDPTNEIISFKNPKARSGGQLDVECICGGCPQGGNENIFWPKEKVAPKGLYKFWVEYYDRCGTSDFSGTQYTIRVTDSQGIVSTQTGLLSSGRSPVWTYSKD